MDRILNSLKKENGPRASSAPALGLNTIIFKHVYWYMQQTQVSVYRTIGPLVSSPEPLGSQGELIRRPSVVRRPSTISKIFFSETAWPTKAKFYMKHLWEGGTNVYIRNPGHMTKMAAMPIYGKNPSKIFSRTGGLISTKLGMKH